MYTKLSVAVVVADVVDRAHDSIPLRNFGQTSMYHCVYHYYHYNFHPTLKYATVNCNNQCFANDLWSNQCKRWKYLDRKCHRIGVIFSIEFDLRIIINISLQISFLFFSCSFAFLYSFFFGFWDTEFHCVVFFLCSHCDLHRSWVKTERCYSKSGKKYHNGKISVFFLSNYSHVNRASSIKQTHTHTHAYSKEQNKCVNLINSMTLSDLDYNQYLTLCTVCTGVNSHIGIMLVFGFYLAT